MPPLLFDSYLAERTLPFPVHPRSPPFVSRQGIHFRPDCARIWPVVLQTIASSPPLALAERSSKQREPTCGRTTSQRGHTAISFWVCCASCFMQIGRASCRDREELAV